MGNVELPQWLTELPLAPVFRPTDTEFADPIAYISKIEKEVGAFGICKVIPPLPKPSKKYVFSNLKKSLCRTRELGLDVDVKEWGDSSKRVSEDRGNDGGNRAVFTTRQQELGIEVRRSRGGVDAPQPAAQKQVWQSGEFYTLEQFESKSKAFSRSVLGSVKQVTPLTVEALFWKAASEEAIYVEYANDVPGSGFGEPKGLSRYFNDCRKRRSMSAGGRSSWRQQGVNDAGNLCTGVEEEALELRKECSDLPTSLPDTVSQSAKQRDFGAGAGADLEGTAGWKLSNCPWNLQVIAHSAGSLTRFMMDDIPGVTSPMVYIGMLFSWFAWHVEDHELHSLNFLHTGSPKTWYAVPGEFAFDFEDVIRRQAYGGDLDHLAALKLLGEKTTLLSPEIVVASGIPCCRLVQNPGEFVVTFPRAYHIGFSHGFNCGEAANFGTPQWLTIAKEAAVRRAAMDHLPMLSHQQLLYILTMSFVSSVPKTLLPGVRSSRLRNRLKEERELLVKKAFIEDVLKENHLLNILIGKKSTFRAVLWHPNSLPSLARDSLSQAETILDAVHNKEAELSVPQHKGANEDIHRLNLCGETLNDLYLDCNDILCDFQVDSGTLVCVACGILGYPIMSVIQPSKEASMECFPAENISLTGAVDVLRQPDPCHIQCCTKSSLLGTNNDDTWDASGFLRPRIFCLEHAVQIEELLRPKGGANMLVICHSDYQKIKANAAAVAEEIRTTFNYKEVRFDSASMEELILIDTAIADEQLTDIQEDWTSKLGINLRFSVKTRKGFLPKKIEHALNIDYLLSIMAPVRRILNIQWLSKKARTKREFNHRTLAKYCDGNLPKKDEIIHVTHSMETKGRVLLQYFRRKYRTKSRNCTGAKYTSGGKSMLCSTEVIDADCEKVYDGNEQETSGTCYLNKEVDFEGVDISPVECLSVHEEIEAPEESREPASNKSSEVMVLTEAFNSTSSDSNLLKIAAGVVEELDNANEDLYFENCSSSPAAAMPDAGKSSSTGKDMRVENGCKVEVSDLPIMCWPEELNDEHAAVDLRVSSIPDHAFQKANTPEAPEESREPASNKSSEVMVLTEAFNSTSSDSNLLKIAAGVVEELDNANEDLDFENCSSSPAATMPDAGKSSSTGKDMSVENGCKVEVSDLPIMCRPEELNDEHAAVDLRVSNISDHAFQKSNTPEADCSSVINNSCNKLEIYAKASLNMTEKLGESVTCKHDATTLEVDMPILPKDSLTDSSLTGAWASPLSSRWEEQDEKLATAKITCGYTRKRRRKVELQTEAQNSFIKSPCEGLRPRKNSSNSVHTVESNVPETAEETPSTKKLKKSSGRSASCNQVLDNKTSYKCNVDGCRMRFRTKVEHSLHKRNQCHHKKCGKSFKSHKYAVLHQRVHDDERPLKCSWTGCTVTFKWAWARTEHMRLHTGERPYQCKIKGCGLTFRFVSEFSRHRRKFGHHVNQPTK